jgi:hypothetical protein
MPKITAEIPESLNAVLDKEVVRNKSDASSIYFEGIRDTEATSSNDGSGFYLQAGHQIQRDCRIL